MYQLLTLIAGTLQSAMASFNGMISNHLGMFGMSLAVHVVGGVLLVIYMKLVTREKLKITGLPWYLYSCGFFGVLLVIVSSYCIGIIGVSITTCLSVTGQLITSAVIDHFGLFGVPKVAFNLRRLPCFGIILAGLLILNLS